MDAGSPPCSPQMPSLMSFLTDLHLSTAICTNCPTPSVSNVWNGSFSKIFLFTYSLMNLLASSLENHKVICVRSFVPNEKNSAVSATLSAVSAPLGTSIIVPSL